MTSFMTNDFLLQTETAKQLYHNYASQQPIFDFHNHLPPKEIYENKTLGNLANAWLDHDHYKWRAMRAAGVPEELITGHINIDGSVKSDEEIQEVFKQVQCSGSCNSGSGVTSHSELDSKSIKTREEYDYQRYLAFVRTLQNCVGNPLYHWSHLELQRYFGVMEPITEDNAKEIWDKCNELLAQPDFAPRGLLEKMQVKALCTTDDPLDSLEYHKKLAAEWKEVKVLPSFRPDLAINAESPAYPEYISKLQEVTGIKINNIDDMIKAFGIRMDYFKSVGSVVSDHSLENDFYLSSTYDDVNYIFEKAWIGKTLSKEELAKYKGYVLVELGKLYAEKGFVMQIHIGALRDQNGAMLSKAGKNIGEDSLQDFNYAPQIGAVLNGIYSACNADHNSAFPKVILYNLNPKDNEALATMAANFRNCIFGPAWWFCDHKDGIEEQIRVYSRTSTLGNYVGMLTDSRSFLSYPRHEYFRRILCNFIGNLVENGEFPGDEKLLGNMVENIAYNNSINFFK